MKIDDGWLAACLVSAFCVVLMAIIVDPRSGNVLGVGAVWFLAAGCLARGLWMEHSMGRPESSGTPIGSVSPGEFVELTGRVECPDPVRIRIGSEDHSVERSCVWIRDASVEAPRDGDAAPAESRDFWLHDDTGHIRVRPEGATIRSPTTQRNLNDPDTPTMVQCLFADGSIRVVGTVRPGDETTHELAATDEGTPFILEPSHEAPPAPEEPAEELTSSQAWGRVLGFMGLGSLLTVFWLFLVGRMVPVTRYVINADRDFRRGGSAVFWYALYVLLILAVMSGILWCLCRFLVLMAALNEWETFGKRVDAFWTRARRTLRFAWTQFYGVKNDT